MPILSYPFFFTFFYLVQSVNITLKFTTVGMITIHQAYLNM